MPIEIKNAEVLLRLSQETLNRKLDVFEQAVSDEATRIVQRTQSGKDVNDQAFAPYSKAYAKVRQKKGRKTSPVDLLFTGKMLAAIQTRIRRFAQGIEATIYFSSPQEAAKAAGNQRLRPFFGLSDEQVGRITKKMTEG